MKKLRIVLATIALSMATIAVIASNVRSTVYYRGGPWQYGPYCDYVITPSSVCEGNIDQCSYQKWIVVNGVEYYADFYISKRVDGMFCQMVPKYFYQHP